MLGAELRGVRERRGLSLRDCAADAQISVSALKAIESGQRYPTLRTLEKLAQCLNVTVVIGPHETFIEPVD